MSGITGEEIHQMLEKACEAEGIDPAVTKRLLLKFAILWGEQLQVMIDKAIFKLMTGDLEAPDDN